MGLFMKIFWINISILILGLSYLIYTEVEFNVQVIDLPPEANAKCLDGSNFRFQFMKGEGEGLNKFLLHFEGGGLCGSTVKSRSVIESCRQRAIKPFGTTAKGFSFTISRLFHIFSSKKERNPPFYNWNKINIHYCDGLVYLGNIDSNGLYFRGLNNTIGVIDYLTNHYNFKNADSVVVTGYSAGAIASLQFANYIDSRTTKKNNTFVIADSGVILDVLEKTGKEHLFPPILQGAMKYTGDNTKMLKTYCKEAESEDKWKCFLVEDYIQNVKVPILLLQNLYDSWMINRLVGIDCILSRDFVKNCTVGETKKMKEYADYTLKTITKMVLENENISAWLPRTIGHVFLFPSINVNNRNFAINNITIMEMIDTWYNQVSKGEKISFEKRLVASETEKNLPYYKDGIYYMVAYKLAELAGFHY